MTLPANAG